MDIKDKVIIVTGASGGIGKATAALLSAEGARPALVARSGEKLRALAAELPGALGIQADMSKEADVTRMIHTVHNHYGRIDILINNAGQGMWSSVEKTKLNEYRNMMDLNVFGPLLAMQAVIPIMRQQGGGMILNISSGVTRMYLPGLGAYASTKYALNALSLTARQELAADNIRVGIMVPGMTDTQFGANALGGPEQGPSGVSRPSSGPTSEKSRPPVESAHDVAERILLAIRTEAAETLAKSMTGE